MLGDPDAEEASLLAVVELMLDMTESSVAFCWELGAGDTPHVFYFQYTSCHTV